jgi:hypothetical protein
MSETLEYLIQARPAREDEFERMTCWVQWMYVRGQVVVLWRRSGRISLLPERVSSADVIYLRQAGTALA